VKDPAARSDKHEHERPQQLREQPTVLEPRIVEVLAVPELEHQQVVGTLRVVDRDVWGFLNWHGL
jgi:hypothetical protein